MTHTKSVFFSGLCGDGGTATCIFSSWHQPCSIWERLTELLLPRHPTGSVTSRAVPWSCNYPRAVGVWEAARNGQFLSRCVSLC